MKTGKKSLKLKRIDGGFYMPEGYALPREITPTKLRRITKTLLKRVKPPAKVS
jgi:hypothetical protein